MFNLAQKIISSEEGQALTDYSLIILLVAIALVITLTAFGAEVNSFYEDKILSTLPWV